MGEFIPEFIPENVSKCITYFLIVLTDGKIDRKIEKIEETNIYIYKWLEINLFLSSTCIIDIKIIWLNRTYSWFKLIFNSYWQKGLISTFGILLVITVH